MLLVEAQGAIERDVPIVLSDYAPVIGQLRHKNYSFGKIAEWLSERLGRSINKGGVFRVYQDWEEDRNEYLAEREAIEPPPDDEEQADRLIREIASEVRNAAEDAAARKSLPAWFASEGVLLAAKVVEREQADERAAETADAAKSETQAPEKS